MKKPGSSDDEYCDNVLGVCSVVVIVVVVVVVVVVHVVMYLYCC